MPSVTFCIKILWVKQMMKAIKIIWHRIRKRENWKQFLYPHPLWLILLSLESCAGLIWVFTTDRDFTWIAYLFYVLSAYTLTVLCIFFWGKLPWLKYHYNQDPLVQKVLKDDRAFSISMHAEQCINFCYGGCKILTGIVIGSAWVGGEGIYNFSQGCIQLYQILRNQTVSGLTQQWKTYRTIGWLIIFMHLTMTGMMFQMIQMGRHGSATEISIIATAAFTFYKLISAFVAVVKDRKHRRPLDSSVIFLNFAQALYNLFVLQVGLLWIFGGADYPYQKLMNTMTGMAVCMLVLGMGIYMVRRANKNLKNEKSTA